MADVKLVSVETVLSSLYRDLRPEQELSENDLIEWAGEALEFIGAYPQYTEAVDYIKVEDYKAHIPCGFHKLVQIAHKVTAGDNCDCAIKITSSDSTTATCTASSCSCSDTVTDPCPTSNTAEDVVVQQAKQLIDYHLTYRFAKTGYFFQNYKPMRLATSAFSRAKLAHCTDCINLSGSCESEYNIDHPYIKTSFKEGNICMSYLKQPTDDRGWPMIPDKVSYIEAIKRYIVYKLKYSEFLTGKLPGNIFAKLEDDWHWYCRQARNKMNMPDTIDKMQNLKDSWKRMFDKPNRYYGFFGRLSEPERLTLQGKY